MAAAKPDVIGFHCTAAATVEAEIGGDLAAHIAGVTGVTAVATSQALVAALRAFEARRIVLVTPYTRAVNEHEIEFFAAHGIEVVDHVWLDKTDAQAMAAVEPDEWIRRAKSVCGDRVEACVLSCANIRVAPIIAGWKRCSIDRSYRATRPCYGIACAVPRATCASTVTVRCSPHTDRRKNDLVGRATHQAVGRRVCYNRRRHDANF
ncbi:MAG: hypothetical protein WDO24_21570 [Pseudomonadota bacterium]